MNKWIKSCLAGLMALSIAGCSNNAAPVDGGDDVNDAVVTTIENKYSVECPAGAPAVGLIGIYNDIANNEGSVAITNQDGVTVALNAGDADIIIAPINLGCKLIPANNLPYKLAGVLTWGNLYIVGTSEEALHGEGVITLFGEKAVPGIVYRAVDFDTTLEPEWAADATLVQASLIKGGAVAGLLAEPAATATIGKAKQEGIELKILADLQALYGEGNGYPQAAVFVRDDVDASDFLGALDQWTNNGYEGLETTLDEIGPEVFGLPSTKVIVNSIERQNVHYKNIEDCRDEVEAFLSNMNITLSDDVIYSK